MLSVKELLARIDDVKNGDGHHWDDPFFIRIFYNQEDNLYINEIEECCPDDMVPMILEHYNYVTGIALDERPNREIVVKLIHDLLEKKPYLHVDLRQGASSWIVECGFQFRNICVHCTSTESLRMCGELLNIEGNNIEGLKTKMPLIYVAEGFKVSRFSTRAINDFVSLLMHENCRVRVLTMDIPRFDMTILRNTLVRRVIVGRSGILLPYKVGECEFETMLCALHKLQWCLPNELWRVIFYLLSS